MAGVGREWGDIKGYGLHGAWMIDDLHTILMILQLLISFARMANHLRANLKPI